MYGLQAQHAKAEAGEATRSEDRTGWMDGLLDETITRRCEVTDIKLAIAFILFVLFIVSMICKIPEGYEDENGFHYGRKDK